MADDRSTERDERVRRLLADARHSEPAPPEVVSRLDDVLARLQAGEEVPGPVGRRVVELAAVRRRRVAQLLVAAAAVVVVGIGLGQVMGSRQGSDSAGSADSAASAADAPEVASGDTGAAGGRAGTSSDSSAQDGTSPEAYSNLDSLAGASAAKPRRNLVVVEGRLPRLSEDEFVTQATRLRDRVGATRSLKSAAGATELADADVRLQRDFQGCEPADWGIGTKVAVMYEAEPAVLAYRKPAGDTQVVDLLQCGTGGVLRSVTLARR